MSAADFTFIEEDEEPSEFEITFGSGTEHENLSIKSKHAD